MIIACLDEYEARSVADNRRGRRQTALDCHLLSEEEASEDYNPKPLNGCPEVTTDPLATKQSTAAESMDDSSMVTAAKDDNNSGKTRVRRMASSRKKEKPKKGGSKTKLKAPKKPKKPKRPKAIKNHIKTKTNTKIGKGGKKEKKDKIRIKKTHHGKKPSTKRPYQIKTRSNTKEEAKSTSRHRKEEKTKPATKKTEKDEKPSTKEEKKQGRDRKKIKIRLPPKIKIISSENQVIKMHTAASTTEPGNTGEVSEEEETSPNHSDDADGDKSDEASQEKGTTVRRSVAAART